MRRTINNKQFAIVVSAIQLISAMMILSSKYADIHWLCIWNMITVVMIIYKYLSDSE